MWPWSELGIEPTDDTRTIKKAYAKLLKQTRPDENPEAFQRLHQAYKDALARIKRDQEHPAPKPVRTPISDAVQPKWEPPSEPDPFAPLPELENSANNTPPPSADRFTIDQKVLNKSDASSSPEAPPPSVDHFTAHQIDGPVNDEELKQSKLKPSPEPPPQASFQPYSPIDDEEQPERPETEQELELELELELGLELGLELELELELEQEQEQEQEQEEYRKRHAVMDQVLTQARQILENSANAHSQSAWQFLNKQPLLLDDEFNQQLGDSLFAQIAQHPELFTSPDSGSALRYLNSLFNWEDRRDQLESLAGSAACDELFTTLLQQLAQTNVAPLIRGGSHEAPPPAITTTPMGSYWLRTVAMMLDWVLIAILITVVAEFVDIWNHSITLPWGLGAPVIYPFAALAFESSRWQATPGKMLFGLRVVDQHLQPLTGPRSILRTLTFMLSIALLWKIIWIFNAFMGGRLLHDRVSRSFVVHKNDLPG